MTKTSFKYSNCFCRQLLLSISFLVVVNVSYGSTTYYVSNSSGNDTNSGTTASTPWKTLAKVSAHTFSPGDSVLLKCGEVWSTVQLNLNGDGTAVAPIVLTSYGTGNMPHIQGMLTDGACISIEQYAGWKITNLELSNAKDGIRAEYDQIYNKNFLWIENCYIHDMNNTYNSQPALYNHFSCGVLINGYTPYGNGRLISLTSFTLKNCNFNNCNIALNCIGTIFSHCNSSGFTTGDLVQLKNFNVQSCIATNGSQWGFSFSSCSNGTIANINTKYIGGGINSYGTASLVAAYSQYLTFNNCNIIYTYRGPQNYDGDGFDFEGGTAPDGTSQHDIILQNSVIDYTDGCGIFVFNNGATGRESKNCTINNVLVSHFGVNFGNTKEGINFATATTGVVENSTFNRNVTSNAFYGGDYSGFTFANCFDNEILTDATPLLSNNSFETPSVINFQYGSFPNDWAFDSGSGIQTNGSSFSSANAPDGQQTAFIQSIGTIQQSLNFPSTGNFIVNFKASKRTCCGGTESFNVYIDSKLIGSFTPSSGSFTGFLTKPFSTTQGNHSLLFKGTVAGDNTDFIDLVNIVPYNPITNGGFEQPLQTAGQYQYGPLTNGWTFDSASGVQSNGSTFSASSAPEGTQTAFIQGLGTIQQTIKLLSGGNFYLQFQAAKRTCCGGTESLKVYYDTTLIGTYTPSSGSYSLFSTSAFAADTNSHLLKFVGTVSGDNTDFIDMVKLMPSGANMGFESPTLASAQYQYGAFTNGWSFNAQSGVQSNGSAFSGTQNAPEGTQTCFVQGQGLVSQNFNFPSAGNFIINFSVAKRANGGGTQSFGVHIDNTLIASYTPSATSFTNITSPPFYISAGTHAIAFLGETNADNTDFVDNVSIGAVTVLPPSVGNFGFENPVLAANQYASGPFNNSWVFSNLSGVQRNGSAYSGTQNAPEAYQTAYITSQGLISQSVNFANSGSYVIRFKGAQRLNHGGPQTFNIRVDSANVGTFKPSSGLFSTLQSNVFSVTQGNHTIIFGGITTGDSTAFVDSVVIVPQNAILNNYAVKSVKADSLVTDSLTKTLAPSDTTKTNLETGKLQIYPNPANARAQVKYNVIRNSTLTLEVHSLYGKMISKTSLGLNTTGTHQANIDINGLPNGEYVVSILGSNYYKYALLLVNK